MNEGTAAPVREHQSVTAVAFDSVVVEVARDGGVRFAPHLPGPPPRVEGYVLGLTSLERSPPHFGERHPDGDELIYLTSGAVRVVIETPGGEQRHALRPGDALIVPRGFWHRIEVDRPARVLHLTPGASGEHRPATPTPTATPTPIPTGEHR
ncbi:MAG: cupin domain-containing protein [Acidimicrobiales bacterium]